MQPTSRDDARREFAEIIVSALSIYDRTPDAEALKVWERTVGDYGNDRVRTALEAHCKSPEEGKRTPRPVDIWRKLNAGSSKGAQCSAQSTAGRCHYPGVFSDGTDGSGQWYCAWHREDRTGLEADMAIESSHEVDFEIAARKRIARIHAESSNNGHVQRLKAAIEARKARSAVPVDNREPGEDEREAA